MAEKKSTTAKAPKAAKTAPKAKKVDYGVMSREDLHRALAEKQHDLTEAQLSHRSGELVNPRVLGETRKEIARIHTALAVREKESK